MSRVICPFWLLLALTPLLLLGCDSNDNERIGHFQGEVQGDVTMRLDGSAQFSIIEGDSLSHFEIMLFAENGPSSEIIFRSAPSGGPQEAQYSVEQTFTGATPHIVRAEFKPDQFDALRYIGEDGLVEITSVTETTIQGQFNFEALDGSTGAHVTINGQFTAQQP